MLYNYHIIFLSLCIFSSSSATEKPTVDIKLLDEPNASKTIDNFINSKQKETSYSSSDIAQTKKLPSDRRKHNRHVNEQIRLNHIHSEGKDILTITYTSTTPEGRAFLKEQYPDIFERAEDFVERNSIDQNPTKPASTKMPQWLLQSSIKNAPDLLQGILTYLQSYQYDRTTLRQVNIVPSFHRFILEGPPGTGKTTLAYAIAQMLNYPIVFIPATSLLGHFRNETSNNIEKFIREQTVDALPKVIIIDEIHKLFEHHTSDHADDSQSAAAFWLGIDKIEKHSPNTIIIGTANSVAKLPPEIKSRFSGKIISMPLLSKDQKIQIFKQNIAHDTSIIIDDSVTNGFIAKMLQQIENCSLRDMQLIIDSAKMFYYSEQLNIITEFPIVLTRIHFRRALDQLQAESEVLQQNLTEKLYDKIKKYGIVLSAAVNVVVLIKASNNLLPANIIQKLLPQAIK